MTHIAFGLEISKKSFVWGCNLTYVPFGSVAFFTLTMSPSCKSMFSIIWKNPWRAFQLKSTQRRTISETSLQAYSKTITFEYLPSMACISCLPLQWIPEHHNEKLAQQHHYEVQTTLDNQYAEMLQVRLEISIENS